MATVIRCDGGCGAESPNPKTRLHEANHWLRVRVENNNNWSHARDGDDLLFCDACAPAVKAALKPKGPRP